MKMNPPLRSLSVGRLSTVLLLALVPPQIGAHGGGGGFGGGGFSGFGEHAGGGAFGGGGFAGGEAQRFGGDGLGAGHFGGGGLGSVRGSQEESGVGRDWSERAGEPRNGNYGEDHARYQQEMDRYRYEDGYHYNRYYGGYYGGSYVYYGGTWGGFYSGMMMGEMSGMMMGASMAALPSQYTTVMVADQPYYYANGAYLTQQSGQTGYTLVPPPPGAVVTYLPSNCTPLYAGQEIYDDCGGAFYKRVPGGYQVTRPPVGLEVAHLPAGAVAHPVGTLQYFEYGGVWYQPFYGGSDIIYRITDNPTPTSHP